MSALVATHLTPAYPLPRTADKSERTIRHHSNLFDTRNGISITPFAASSLGSRHPALLHRVSTPSGQSLTETSSSDSSDDAFLHGDRIMFSGWREQTNDDGEIELHEIQRFPTSYLRHRCSTPVEDNQEMRNYVWSAPREDDTDKAAMMEQDVDVKIEEVDVSIEENDEATFWQVSGPGFVWRHDEDEVNDFPMDEA
ncbi:hypothetical protein PENSPDRAFT_717503 [Peniophora sp. CONT]|nr:hypothetical protein PENSPDRAFT_717503 [Peniophora sp. CONT]